MYDPFLNILGVLMLFGVGQSYFLAIGILFKNLTKTSLILSLLLIVMGYGLLMDFLFYSKFILEIPILCHTSGLLEPLFSPLLFFFVLILIKPMRAFKWYDTFHLLPFTILSYKDLPFISRSIPRKLDNLKDYYSNLDHPEYGEVRHLDWVSYIFSETFIYELLPYIYLIVTFVIILKSKNDFSKVLKSYVNWLKIILVLVFIFLSLSKAISIFSWISHDLRLVLLPISSLFQVVLVHIIAFGFLNKKIDLDPLMYKKPYEEVNLSEENRKQMLQHLQKTVEENKLYRKSDFSITYFGKVSEIHPRMISLVLNQQLGVNFNNFINQYRVNDAKELILDAANQVYTIEYLGEVVGFNSKSIFYTQFKKHTGMTPMQFKNSN